MDIYHWVTGRAVTGRIRDIGQNVLQPPFQTGSSSSPTFFPISFLTALLEEAFISNVITALHINCTIVTRINNNNTVINNNYGKPQDLTLLFKTPMSKAKEFLQNLQKIRARAVQKISHPWSNRLC